MTKEWLFSVANKGTQKYNGAEVKIYIHPSELFDGKMMISGVLCATNPFTTDMSFGSCLVENVTDEDVSKLKELLDKEIKHMEMARAASEKDPILMEWADDRTLKKAQAKGRKERERFYGYEAYRNDHFSIYTFCGSEYDTAIGTPVVIDGKLYRAIYSYWLSRFVYPFDQTSYFGIQ